MITSPAHFEWIQELLSLQEQYRSLQAEKEEEERRVEGLREKLQVGMCV